VASVVPLPVGGRSVALEVPDGWRLESSAAFPVEVYAPSDEGYRASIALSLEEGDASRPDWLETCFARVHGLHRAQLAEYEEVERCDRELRGRRCRAVRYRWCPVGTRVRLEQLLLLVPLEPGRALRVDAASLADRAGEYFPLFERVLASLDWDLSPPPGPTPR